MAVNFTLADEEKKYLGEVAKWGIMCGFTGKDPRHEEFPAPNGGQAAAPLGCFVTITIGGNLRGCIGMMVSEDPLYKNVATMAYAAAFNDRRFPPLRKEEWEEAKLEISVLGPMTPCPAPEQVEVGRHGLVLAMGGRSGVFLPKVPVEQGWNRLQYLDHLCLKAGLPTGSWKQPSAQLFWYEALAFEVQ